MKEVTIPEGNLSLDVASFLACLASILEMPVELLPLPGPDEDPATGWTVSRWLGGLGLGLARLADPTAFSWAGPWIARVRRPGTACRHAVVMYGVPSGLLWDPTGNGGIDNGWIQDGFLVAAADIALALPPRPAAPVAAGTVEGIWVAPAAGEPARSLASVRALAGQGLAGDRHVLGTGTFPSGLPGSALTLIAAEVCASFDPPLGPDEHRRNVLTRGVDLNGLVGREFMVGAVRCRGMRLCEPCRVIQGYAARPVLRQLVHRGGLRADILADGEIHVGDAVRVVSPGTDG
ncbi:MAG TPA: MOSC domain-containing protein [Thermomicrobiaceae bacterium]|nr:MOSC domain-containing protein [Thermomicrobiaceae bacterium]